MFVEGSASSRPLRLLSALSKLGNGRSCFAQGWDERRFSLQGLTYSHRVEARVDETIHAYRSVHATPDELPASGWKADMKLMSSYARESVRPTGTAQYDAEADVIAFVFLFVAGFGFGVFRT